MRFWGGGGDLIQIFGVFCRHGRGGEVRSEGVGSEGVGILSLDGDGEGDFSLYLWRGRLLCSRRVGNGKMNPQRVQRAETQIAWPCKTRTRPVSVWVLAWLAGMVDLRLEILLQFRTVPFVLYARATLPSWRC